jgi:hypothetical protein
MAAIPSTGAQWFTGRTPVRGVGWTSGSPDTMEAFQVYIEPSQRAPRAPEGGPYR